MSIRFFAGVLTLLALLPGTARAEDPRAVFANAPAAAAEDSFAAISQREHPGAAGEAQEDPARGKVGEREDPPHLHGHLGSPAAVPEPGIGYMLGAGLVLLAGSARLRRSARPVRRSGH